jgi:RNA polymerase sigma-70 factor (ECF subfamily)
MDDLDADFARLIEGARSGDGAAVAALLGRFEPEIRTMVRVRLPRALRNQFDSMDFVQAVWTSVFAGKPDDVARFTDPGQFRGFLAGVARNKVFEEHRRRTRTRKYDLGREERLYVRKGEREVPRDVAADDPTPSEEVQADERLDQLLQGRSPEEIAVVQLRREGLTFEEIGQRLGTSERSARRVIDSIRERMEARGWR